VLENTKKILQIRTVKQKHTKKYITQININLYFSLLGGSLSADFCPLAYVWVFLSLRPILIKSPFSSVTYAAQDSLIYRHLLVRKIICPGKKNHMFPFLQLNLHSIMIYFFILNSWF